MSNLKKRGATAPLILTPTFAILLSILFLIILLTALYTIFQSADFEKAYLAQKEGLLVTTLGALPDTANVDLFSFIEQNRANYSFQIGKTKITVVDETTKGFTGHYAIPKYVNVIDLPKTITNQQLKGTGTQFIRLFKEAPRIRIESKNAKKHFNQNALTCANVKVPIQSIGIDAGHGLDTRENAVFVGDAGHVAENGLEESLITRLIAAPLVDQTEEKYGLKVTRELSVLIGDRTKLAFTQQDPQQAQRIRDRITSLQDQNAIISIHVGPQERANQIIAFVDKDNANSVALACRMLNNIAEEFMQDNGRSLVTGTAIVPVDLTQLQQDDITTSNIDEADPKNILVASPVGVLLEIGALNDAITRQPDKISAGITNALGGDDPYA